MQHTVEQKAEHQDAKEELQECEKEDLKDAVEELKEEIIEEKEEEAELAAEGVEVSDEGQTEDETKLGVQKTPRLLQARLPIRKAKKDVAAKLAGEAKERQNHWCR